MANKIGGITIEIGGDTTKLDQALKNVNKEAKNASNELREVNKSLKLDPHNVELLSQKQKILTESIQATSEKLKILKDAQEQAKAAFERGEMSEQQYRAIQREVANTEAELRKLESEIKNVNPALETLGQKVQDVGGKFQKAGESIQKIGDGMQNAGQKLMPVTTAITGVGAASVAAAVDFEDAMAKLNTIADTSEKTGVPLEELGKQIMSLSDQTGISASEIADNVYNAISAGQKTGDAVNFVAQSTKLATAGFADSGQALDLLTTILNAYGMSAEEVNHVSDVLINTQNLGKTTVGELASAMGKVIPTANASNVSLENLAAGYSIMTANGIATAESTTYMNSMLNELSKSGTKASTAIKEKTGKSFQDLMKDGASLADVLTILQESAEENGVAMGDMFGSAEAGKAALTLLSGGADQFNETLKSMTDASGTTDAAFEKLDTTSRKAKITLNEIKNAAIDLGSTILEMVMPYFEQLTQKVKDATTWFKNLDDGQKKLIVKIGAVVAAIAPALIVGGKVVSGIGKLTSGIGGVITKIGALIPKLAALASPVGIIIAAIAALAAAFIYLYKTNDDFRNKVNEAVEKVKTAFQDMVQKVKPLLQKLGEAFKNLMTALEPVFEFILTYIMSVVNGVINAAAPVIAAITNVVDFVTNIINAFVALLQGDFDGFFDYIGKALQNVIDFAKNIIKAWVSFIVGFFEGFGVDVKKLFSDIWTGIQKIFQNVGKWFSDRFTEAYTNITNIFKNIGQWFADRWTDIKNALSTVATWFQTMFQNAYTNVVNIWKAVGQWFADRWTDIKNALSTVATWFQTTFQNAYTNVQNVWRNVGQWFSDRWTDIKNVFNNIGEWFRQKFQSAYDSVTGIWKNIGSWFQTNVIDAISNLFNNFSLADAGTKIAEGFKNAIKAVHLPSISVEWGEKSKTIGDVTITIPWPTISWNALGGIMKNPTLFGMYGGKLQGGGEAGDEAILPLDMFYKRTEAYIDDAITRATAAATGGGSRGGNYIQNINIESPEPLSPYEVARQTRNATRNMVLQLQGGRA